MILSRDYGTKVFIRLLTKQQTKSIIEKISNMRENALVKLGREKVQKKTEEVCFLYFPLKNGVFGM